MKHKTRKTSATLLLVGLMHARPCFCRKWTPPSDWVAYQKVKDALMMPQRTKDRYSDDTLKKLDTYNGVVYGLQVVAANLVPL